MKKILLFLPLFLVAEDFISNFEYGKMLYKNPRGIGCIKCHGADAKGKVIATYVDDDGKKVKVIAPNIKKVSWKVFYQRLKYSKVLKKGKFKTLNYSYMPRYDYLVDDEIKAIFNYIKAIK
jgi:mono/diheme cytochrome c family protein